MLGLAGSLLGSVASGALGLFGQSSANKQNTKLANTAYQRSVHDMEMAGLNPAAMYGSGLSPAGVPQMQNTMAGPAEAAKQAASSASQILVANKTIDQLSSQIAKTQADTINTKAALGSIASQSKLDTRREGAISRIPDKIYQPLVQSGFGADTMRATGKVGAGVGAGAASAKSVVNGVRELLPSLSGPSMGSARELKRAWDKKSPALWEAIKKSLPDFTPYPVKRKNETVVYKNNLF